MTIFTGSTLVISDHQRISRQLVFISYQSVNPSQLARHISPQQGMLRLVLISNHLATQSFIVIVRWWVYFFIMCIARLGVPCSTFSWAYAGCWIISKNFFLKDSLEKSLSKRLKTEGITQIPSSKFYLLPQYLTRALSITIALLCIWHYIAKSLVQSCIYRIHKTFCGWFNFVIFVVNLNPQQFFSKAKYHPRTIFPLVFCLHWNLSPNWPV